MDNGDSPSNRSRSVSEEGSRHGSENGHSPRPAGRSRSRSNSAQRYRKRSRSRSASPRRGSNRSPGRRDYKRGSPGGSRRRPSQQQQTIRENPPAGRCLGVFGLSIYTQERHLKDVFSKYGALEDVQIVYDAQTGRSRGFSFVYFENKNDAAEAKERCNGIEIDGRKIRVDFSVTQRAHTPTPGIYMGKPTHSSRYRGGGDGGGRDAGGRDASYRDGGFRDTHRGGYRGGRGAGGGGGGGGYGRRSPSPYGQRDRRGGRYSRSRSHSPRRTYR